MSSVRLFTLDGAQRRHPDVESCFVKSIEDVTKKYDLTPNVGPAMLRDIDSRYLFNTMPHSSP